MSQKTVARGLGLADGFNPKKSAALTSVSSPAEQGVNAVEESVPPRASTSRVVRKATNRTTTRPQPVDNSSPKPPPIPREIVAGDAPLKRSGRGRVGVSRKYNGDVVKTTVVLPTAVHDKLAEIMFHNRKTSKESLNDLMLQGIDLLLADYGLEPMDQLVQKAEQA